MTPTTHADTQETFLQDELDRGSDNSDEDLPDLNFNNSTHLDTLAQGIAGAVSEDDLLSPDKAAHKKRAREVASILGDEEKKKLKAGLAGETPEERQARKIWRDSYRFEVFDAEVLKGEGWIGQIAAAIRGKSSSLSSYRSLGLLIDIARFLFSRWTH